MFEDSVALIPSIWASMNSWFTPAVFFVLLNIMIGTIAFTSNLANQNKNNHPQNQENSSQNISQNLHQQQQQNNNNNTNKLTRSASLLQRFRSINFYNHRSQESSTNLVATTHFKLSPDSNTVYSTEHTHQSETLENAADYIFDQPHEQNNQPTDDTHMQHYDMFQKNQENVEETNTQFFFEQIHETEGEETENHFEFEQEDASTFDNDDENDDGGDEFQSLDEVYSQLKGHHHRTTSDTEPASGKVPAKLPKKMKKSASSKSAFGHFKVEDIVEARRPATVRERGVAKVTESDDGVDAKADDFINKFKQQLKLQRMDSLMRYKDMITRGSGK